MKAAKGGKGATVPQKKAREASIPCEIKVGCIITWVYNNKLKLRTAHLDHKKKVL